MLDKKDLIRIEKKFSSLNLLLAGILIVYYLLFIWFGHVDLTPSSIIFAMSVFLLGIDFIFGNFNFFDSDFLIKIVKFCELFCFAVFTFQSGGFVLNAFIAGMVYLLITIQVLILFDITEIYSCVIGTVFNAVPLFLALVLELIINDVSNFYIFIYLTFLAVFIMCEANFLNTFSEIFNILYHKISVLNEIVITNREENDTMKSTHEKIIQVNEQLSIQRFQLQKANEQITRNNQETTLLNLIAKDVTVYLKTDKLMKAFINNIMKYMKYDFCYMAVVEHKEESFLHYIAFSEESHITKKNETLINKKYFVQEHLNNSVTYVDNYAYVKMECFRDSRILSSVFYPVKINNDTSALYIIGSTKEDYFKNNEKFINNMFSQITMAFNNVILYARMHTMAVKDALTGIYNRQYFNSIYNKFMEQCKEQNRTITVVLFDIDKFKNINDTYGHVFGDKVISYCGHMAANYATEKGSYAVRYGGEEFVMIFPDKDTEKVFDICHRMHEEIKHNVFNIIDEKIHINISIGIASYHGECTNPRELVNLADKAMYYSKEHGRGRITVYKEELYQ